jgi:molybdopterin converting factor small subunit
MADVTVKIHTLLIFRKLLGSGEMKVCLPQGSSIKDLLFRLVEMGGDELTSHLFQPGTDQCLPHIVIMVYGRSIQPLNLSITILHDGDQVFLLPPVAGG